MRTRRAYALLFLAIGVEAAFSATAAPAKGTRLHADLRIASLYDSNILQYSDEDQQAFLAREPASRFGIESLDDVMFSGAAAASLSRTLFSARATRLRYGYTQNAFVENPVEDSRLHTVALLQPLLRTGWVEIAYSRVPHSYVRHLWDEDRVAPFRYYPHYAPAVYESDRLRFSGGLRPSPSWALSGRVARTLIDYNADFEERDAGEWEFGAECERGRDEKGTVTLGLGYTQRRADATDPAHPAVPDSLRDDTSFQEVAAILDAAIPAGQFLKVPAEVGIHVGVARRRFTTDRVADIDHHGRQDTDVEVGLELGREIRRGVGVFATFRFDARSSSGAVAVGDRGDVSDYDRMRVGGGIHLSWSGRVP